MLALSDIYFGWEPHRVFLQISKVCDKKFKSKRKRHNQKKLDTTK
jgi:hypothetical protein